MESDDLYHHRRSYDDGELLFLVNSSYAVLGDTGKRDAALATARKRFAADPELLQALDAAAKTEPMR